MAVPAAAEPSDLHGPLRALHILETLASMKQPAGLAAIAARSQLSPTRAYRTLRGLQEQGFVDHTGRRGYRVGSRSVALASVIGPRPAMLQRARPVLTRVASLGFGATLHLRSGDHRVLVLGVAGSHGGASGYLIGERAPLVSGCSGTSILAHLSSEEARLVIARRPPRTAAAERRIPHPHPPRRLRPVLQRQPPSPQWDRRAPAGPE